MGDSFLEYAGVPPRRLAAWQDVLRDARSLDQLWPYLESVPRMVDARDPHVAAYLDSLRRETDLPHALNGFERILLGLIGPQGQAPHAPRQHEIPHQPYTEAWLALAFDTPNLAPGPAATQVVRGRAFLLPAQVKDVAAPRPVPIEACRAHPGVEGRYLCPLDDEERARYAAYEVELLRVARLLHGDLRAMAARGEAYVGWTAWYGYE